MRRTLLLGLLFATATTLAADKAGPAFDIKKILGNYQGLALNGPGLQPVDTSFSVGREGQLLGNYVLHGPEIEFRGHLSNTQFEGNRRLSMEWTDKDGEGQVVLEFASDYQSFTGEWSDNKGGSGPWGGKKVLGPVTDAPLRK